LGDPNAPQPRLNDDGTPNETHGEHPILKDPLVRQAIAYALSRDEIVAQARLGQGIPLYSNVLPIVSWAYNIDLEPRDGDRDRANQLLDQAGWAKNERTGVRTKNGRPLHLRLHTNTGNQVREAMAAIVRKQLGQVGIEVELITMDWYSFLDVLFGQTFDMALVSWSNLGADPHDERLWSAETDQPGSGTNFVSYHNPQVEALLEQARSTPGCDLGNRAQLYRQIQAELYLDQPYCWLDVPRNLVAINRRGGGTNPGAWDIWYNLHQWYVSP